MPEQATAPKKVFPFMIGADPEFNVSSGSKRIDAHRLFNRAFCNSLEETDNGGFMIKVDGKEVGEIGWDGCDATGEVRPMPSADPAEVVSNLQHIFAKTYEKCRAYSFSTLSEFAPVGGHIHLDLPARVNEQKIAWINRMMSSFFLPIMLSEDSVNVKMRTGGGYGKIGDERTDIRNNKMVFEFRPATAEWLSSPKIAMATLCYVAVVFHEIVNKPSSMKKHQDVLLKNMSQASAIQEVAVSQFLALTEGLMKRIAKAVRTFELYPIFKDEIEYILNPKKVIADKRKTGYEIMKGWELKKEEKVTLRALFDRKSISEKIKDIDIEDLKDMVEISYNDDQNMSSFVSFLKERMVALNWSLKHKYVFYGIRKGINSSIIMNAAGEMYTGQELIKCKDDYASLKEISNKIQSNYLNSSEITRDGGKDAITFGIDQDTRRKQEWNKVLKVLYKIERGTMRPKTMTDLKTMSQLTEAEKTDPTRICNAVKNAQKSREGVIQADDLVVSNKTNYQPTPEPQEEELEEPQAATRA